MNYNIKTTASFERKFKQLSKRHQSLKDDFAKFLTELNINPNQGVEISPNVYKMRMSISSKGKGKSGGARIISYIIVVSLESADVNLLTIYDKSDRDSISKSEIIDLIKLAEL